MHDLDTIKKINRKGARNNYVPEGRISGSRLDNRQERRLLLTKAEAVAVRDALDLMSPDSDHLRQIKDRALEKAELVVNSFGA